MKRDKHKRFDEYEDDDVSFRPKNRVMCPDCGKQKMLFETEKKAENFIKWNGDKLDTTHNMLRAYYCPACCGWHISHKCYRESYDTHTDNMIQAYREQKKSLTKIDKIVRSKEYEEHIKLVEKKAQEIWNDLPEKIQKSYYKGTVKKYITQYIKVHGIENDGDLRTAIYKLWRKYNNSTL